MIRTTPLSLMAVVSLFFAIGIVTAFAEDAEAPPDKKPQPSTEQILEWVRDLDSDRFESYQKLLREQAWMERKQRATGRKEEKLRWQKVVREARDRPISAE